MTTWKTHPNCSEFGSPSEDSQQLALASKVFGRTMNCNQANSQGVYYFATCPDWVNGGKRLMNSNGTQVFPNAYMPAELKNLQPGAKIRFRYKGREAVGTFLDVGPASWTKRYLDLGYPLARYLKFPGTGTVEWTLELTDSPMVKEVPMAKPTVKQVLAAAQRDVGMHDSPSGSDKNPITKWFGRIGAYCAMSICHWFHEAGWTDFPMNAGAHELLIQLRDQFHWLVIKPADMDEGDIIQFTWSHTGIVKRRISKTYVLTIEGNSEDSGVHEETRANSEIAFGIRPPYGKAAPVTPPAPAKPATPFPPTPKDADVLEDTVVTNETGVSRRGTIYKGDVVGIGAKNASGFYAVYHKGANLRGWAIGDHLKVRK